MAWTMGELVNDSLMTQTGRWCWVVRPVRLALLGTRRAGADLNPCDAERKRLAMWVNDEPLFAVPATMPLARRRSRRAMWRNPCCAANCRARTASDAEGLASGPWWRTPLAPGGRMHGWCR